MTLRYFIAIVLATSTLISAQYAQYSPFPTRRFSNPVQAPGFANDPALTTRRPLVIITPTDVLSDDIQSTLDPLLTIETIVPLVAEITSTSSALPSTPSSSSTPSPSFTTSTPFVAFTPTPTIIITTATTTTTTTTNDEETQVASPIIPSIVPFIGARSAKPPTTSSTSNPASVPTAFANAAVGLIAIVGLAMAL